MKSKISNLAILLIVGFPFITFSQSKIGIKIGSNFADARVNSQYNSILPDQNTWTGLTTGVIAEIPLLNGFSFRPELLYTQKGFSVNESTGFDVFGVDIPIGVKANTTINFIELPVLAKYSIGTSNASVYMVAGPTIGYAINGNVQPKATLLIDFNLPQVDIPLDSDMYNRWEIGGAIGVGGQVAVGSGEIFADLRYTMGFSNMLNDPIIDLQVKNQAVALSAGYAYRF